MLCSSQATMPHLFFEEFFMENEKITLHAEFKTLKDSIDDPIIGITRTIDYLEDDLDEETGVIPIPDKNTLDSLREDAEEAISALQSLLELITRLEKSS
jgi:hypothetical protein